MIRLKNEKEIDGIRTSCRMLAEVFEVLRPQVHPGVTTKELDRIARAEIEKLGGRPAFLGYMDYPASLCVSVNQEVIHGIPGPRKLVEGDIVSLDLGIDLGGYFSDKAETVGVGKISDNKRRLVDVTRECLDLAIANAVAGNRIRDISRAVYDHAKEHGYGVVRDYCGHGVGLSPHEDPQVPNYVGRGPNPRLVEGMVLAIEPMINLGTGQVSLLADDWTVVTRDGMPSAHWEHTVLIMDGRTEILTEFE